MTKIRRLPHETGELIGKTVLVTSCGPSFIHWREIYEKHGGSDLFVVCVKQSYEDVGDLCDMHVLNSGNIKRYKYTTSKPVVVIGRDSHNSPIFSKADLSYKVVNDSGELSDSLAVSKNFDELKIDMNSIYQRPWGPGIMYEFVIPYIIFCGAKKIITIGWDIADVKGINTHYNQNSTPVSTVRKESSVLRSVKNYTPEFIKSKLRLLFACYKHLTGKKYNIAMMQDGEAKAVSESMPSFIAWVEKQGVSIDVNSDSKWINK